MSVNFNNMTINKKIAIGICSLWVIDVLLMIVILITSVGNKLLPYEYSIGKMYTVQNAEISKENIKITFNNCVVSTWYRGDYFTSLVINGEGSLSYNEKLVKRFQSVVIISDSKTLQSFFESSSPVEIDNKSQKSIANQLLELAKNKAYHLSIIGKDFGLRPDDSNITMLFNLNTNEQSVFVDDGKTGNLVEGTRSIMLYKNNQTNVSQSSLKIYCFTLFIQITITMLILIFIYLLTNKDYWDTCAEFTHKTTLYRLIIYIVLYVCLNLITYFIYSKLPSIYGRIFSVLSFILFLGLLTKIEKINIKQLGFKRKKILKTVMISFIASLIGLFLGGGLRLNFSNFNLVDIFTYFIWYFLYVSLSEELFFRGFLQNKFEVLFGPAVSIFLSSLAMGIVHVPQRIFLRGFSLPEAIILGLIGVALTSLPISYLYYKTKNLYAAIVYHGMLDFIPKLLR